jgi:hypothetical protein
MAQQDPDGVGELRMRPVHLAIRERLNRFEEIVVQSLQAQHERAHLRIHHVPSSKVTGTGILRDTMQTF